MAEHSSGPAMSQIGKAQNEEPNLRRYLAADNFYGIAKWLHFGGLSLTVSLALISPLVLLFWPDAGAVLGAIAGAWLFASRLLLEPFKRQQQLKGATAQEMFDCGIFNLDWNETLVRPLSEEEVRGASGAMKDADRVRDWYPTSEEMSWPKSVLVCQRSNAVWARRQHRAYSRVLLVAAGAWAIIGVIVALADGASLADYLVTIALPSLPALLDATEFARAHSSDADKRQLLEDKLNDLLGDGSASSQDLREIQDQLFNLRRDAPLVPGWFYRLIRPKFEEDMRYAAQRASEDGSAGQTESD
jgi:hypothetical protein